MDIKITIEGETGIGKTYVLAHIAKSLFEKGFSIIIYEETCEATGLEILDLAQKEIPETVRRSAITLIEKLVNPR